MRSELWVRQRMGATLKRLDKCGFDTDAYNIGKLEGYRDALRDVLKEGSHV